MYVELLKYTTDPEKVVALAARLCYTKSTVEDLNSNLSHDYAKKLVRKIISLGHLSVLEHVSFTFGVEGISRATSHQLVRHRIASYSQQSQRYVEFDNIEIVIPPSIQSDGEALASFREKITGIESLYRMLIEKGIPPEDARYILPNAAITRIIITMNARELNHFFQLRCCRRAQWEIRNMAKEMLKKGREVAPVIFEKSGPGCLRGPCTEGEFTCGKPDEVRKEFLDL
ncbi:MAG: FAD-dependent thymidylate synthase [Deltaproteobacteria bacterium]|nr:FAD-dependent thymidylate synthase [Deltaproteobacteria bacterium]NIS78546.1 FAD-dependent thymidylate synthase [Deltaproteobacteria bacterium]